MDLYTYLLCISCRFTIARKHHSRRLPIAKKKRDCVYIDTNNKCHKCQP
jgi:hypothetical protein